MRKSKFIEAQIVGILREAEKSGMSLPDLCRKHGISAKTFYRYKRIYGSTNESQSSQLRQMQQENTRLKKLLVEWDLEIEMMKEIAEKKW